MGDSGNANTGGRLVGSELEPEKVAQARANLSAAGLGDLADVREGDALAAGEADRFASKGLLRVEGDEGDDDALVAEDDFGFETLCAEARHPRLMAQPGAGDNASPPC
ncbi:MAG TPA: hypothetical protein VGI39_10125 [Polyangiaceae bacterium]|jgi:hypothetical protein